MKKKSNSSREWMKEHVNDPYVQSAQKDGYRSRAAYKLLEIAKRDRLFHHGMVIVDLGAAPGGWSQVAANYCGKNSTIIACDLLAMEPLVGVDFIQGDFESLEVEAELLKYTKNSPVDLVMSDMAPNISGVKSVDQPRSIGLSELALDFAQKVLAPKGNFLIKVFNGAGTEGYIKQVRGLFEKVSIRKPDASRSRSAEIYILAKGYEK